ncbi:caveolin-2 isoform X2 [Tenrec ecaudatus]|uniref:caveolin-2 isoform X2 n=1 Tax=Tenrec ecaudatus TaxID=94439 RepID=UPI003F5AAAA4
MGLESEKADVQLFMDDDAYSRHSGVDFVDAEKFSATGPDRDPHRLNSHLQDYNAFCKDLPNGAAFSADSMEERDRCCHCTIVHKRGTELLVCQPAAEPGLRTWTPVWSWKLLILLCCNHTEALLFCSLPNCLIKKTIKRGNGT